MRTARRGNANADAKTKSPAVDVQMANMNSLSDLFDRELRTYTMPRNNTLPKMI
jgi:hypothetical protein